jgi:signal transduction histidine kinase
VDVSYESFLARVHPEDRERVRDRVELACADGRPFSLDHRAVLPDRSVRTLHARGEVVLDDAGRPVRMVGTAQDITERKLVDDLRNDILSAVSHELRNPLASILGFSLTLRARGAKLSDPVVEEIVAHLTDQATRLDRLLSDLLDVDRFRRGLAHVSTRPTDVALLVAQVVGWQGPDRHAIVVEAEPVIAEIDAPKVERIVDNLLANAIKYTAVDAPIMVRVAARPDGVLISVDDQGPGIPDELKQSVFDVFERGVQANQHPSGTGIGLALVSQFARLHGGRAWVEDSAAGGASFRVLLPPPPG